MLPVGLLLIGRSSHWCSCSTMLGCTHTTVSVGAATKRRVAKDMALHVQYLLKSILCNSHEQIQQLMTTLSVAAALSLLYWDPSKNCHHGCPITKEVTKVTGHQLTNETQGTRIIPDLFLEHLKFGHLLTGCQCSQSDFRTRHPVSLSFTMNAIKKNHPGVTVNLLLTVNTGNEGNGNPFITPTIAPNHLNSMDN